MHHLAFEKIAELDFSSMALAMPERQMQNLMTNRRRSGLRPAIKAYKGRP